MQNKKNEILILCIFTSVLITFFVTPGWADEKAEAAREIISKWQDAVVTVKMVIKQRVVVEGRERSKRENETEATAAVIDSSGLAVLSLFSTDPTGILNVGQSGSRINWESEVTDLKMIFSDGSELPAKIVLRDRDLDLAFVRPTEKLSKPNPALDLSKYDKLDILDHVLILNRLGKVASRVTSVSLCRIEAIVKKPRTFYVPGSVSMGYGFGAPVFSLNGKIVGLLLLRTLKSQSIETFGISGRRMLPVILPAEDIVEVAKQVPKISDEKKGEK